MNHRPFGLARQSATIVLGILLATTFGGGQLVGAQPSATHTGELDAGPALDREKVRQASGQEELISTRIYKVQFLDLGTLAQLASQLCASRGGRGCDYDVGGDQMLFLSASERIHAEFASMVSERDVPPASQSFLITILSADRSGVTADDLPEGAARALEDLRGFLPYTGFRLIDTGWMRTSSRAAVAMGEAGAFTAELRFRGDPQTGAALLVDGFELTYRDWISGPDGKVIFTSDRRLVLSTSFGISVGETVVVGTSKLDGGDEALVVLLSAVQ